MFESVLGTRMILFELPRFNFIYSQYCHCFNWEKKSLQPFSWNFFGPCQFMGTVLLVILQDCTGIMDQKAKNSRHITSSLTKFCNIDLHTVPQVQENTYLPFLRLFLSGFINWNCYGFSRVWNFKCTWIKSFCQILSWQKLDFASYTSPSNIQKK